MSPNARVFAALAMGVAVGWGVSRLTAPAAPPGPSGPPSESAPPSSSLAPELASASRDACAPPAPDAAPPDAASLVDRARRGDLDALKTLDERVAADRTIEESVALEVGHAALARADGARLAADLAADPKLFADTSTMAYAYRLSLDASAAPALLSGLAAVDSPVVPDLLHDLATRAEPGSRLGILASDLLRGRAVRRRASPPLAVALDLADLRDCASVAATLGRVESTADARILSTIERLEKEDGCGPKSKDDCWPCLRDADTRAQLERARDAAKGRAFHAPWTLGR